jgi:hypothetical protein
MEEEVCEAASLRAAAAAFLDTLHDEFRESVVLTRAFMTRRYGLLPVSYAAFARAEAVKKGVGHLLRADTPVLSLLASRGVEAKWDDIYASEGHLAIPLVSESFIHDIPMVFRLLSDVGFRSPFSPVPGETWSDDPANPIRTFYVSEASEARDDEGRFIINSQDFVTGYGVRTVFGGGGAYDGDPGQVFAFIFFARDYLKQELARAFEPLCKEFHAATAALVRGEKIFD